MIYDKRRNKNVQRSHIDDRMQATLDYLVVYISW